MCNLNVDALYDTTYDIIDRYINPSYISDEHNYNIYDTYDTYNTRNTRQNAIETTQLSDDYIYIGDTSDMYIINDADVYDTLVSNIIVSFKLACDIYYQNVFSIDDMCYMHIIASKYQYEICIDFVQTLAERYAVNTIVLYYDGNICTASRIYRYDASAPIIILCYDYSTQICYPCANVNQDLARAIMF